MKVSILAPRTPRVHFAGIENSVTHISKALKEAGYEVEIFATADKPKLDAELDGIKIHEFKAFAPNESYFISRKLYNAVKKNNADIIHCNGYNNLITFAGILAKKKHQKLVLTLNSSGPSSKFRRLLWTPYGFAFNLIAKKVDLFICVSKFEYKTFTKKIKAPKSRFVVIPNGVDVEFIESVKQGTKENYIISIGRLVKNKGFQHLINAFPKVLEKFPKLKLKIVGDGPFSNNLKRLVEKKQLTEKIEFVGWVPAEQRKKYVELLKKAKAFVFLSNYESQGIVISESAAAGVPAIVTDKSATGEFIETAGAVGIDEPEDLLEVSEKIISVLEQPEKFAPKKEAAWKWSKVAKKTLEQYKKLSL